MAEALLETIDLTKHFRIGGMFGARLHALDDVSLRIDAGEIVAVVGESGSGKSTLARLLAKVFQPSGGNILFRGRSLAQIRSRRELLAYRGQVPMVFQDPFSALNPVHTIGYTLGRVLALHQPGLSGAAREGAAVAALEDVGLSPARQTLAKYPHELSGGQRQRVGFAQALACGPKLILADEPVSMLDVSIRIGLLNLMARLRDEAGISLLYITHDIASARYVSDRVLVMYAGQVVESGAAEAVLGEPLHPYTRLLLSAVPDPAMAMTLEETEPGEPPRVINPGPGCRFRFRCRLAINICAAETPGLAGPAQGHQAACHVTVNPAAAR
jgi:peptide/nickel transport system ATP-binding protein